MKLNGQKVLKPKGQEFEFYRKNEEGEDVIFVIKIKPVLDRSKMDDILPEPQPPVKTIVKTGQQIPNFDDETYKKNFENYLEASNHWFYIETLENCEWTKVKKDEPDTWKYWREELEEFLLDMELTRLLQKVNEVNNPTNQSAKNAFDSFTQDTSET